MRLTEYINRIGVKKFAKLVGEKERTVKSWRDKCRYPRPSTAKKIVEKTPVTMEGIYNT